MSENASPQLEGGYTRIANELMEAISLYPFTGGEAKTLWVIIRNTYGYKGKKMSGISLTELAKMTNLTRRHIINILRNLKESSVITVIKDNKKNLIGINKNYTNWRLWISDWSKLLHFTTQVNGVSPKQ